MRVSCHTFYSGKLFLKVMAVLGYLLVHWIFWNLCIKQMSCWLWYMQYWNTSCTHLFGARSCTFLLHLLIVEKNEIRESRVFQPQVVLATVLLVTNRQMLHAATLLLDQTFELMVKIIWIKLWKSSLANNKYVLQLREIITFQSIVESSVNCQEISMDQQSVMMHVM